MNSELTPEVWTAIRNINRIIHGMTWESDIGDLWDYLVSLPVRTAKIAMIGVAVRNMLEIKDACAELDLAVVEYEVSRDEAMQELRCLFSCRQRKARR
jgi:hypothetical protein